jgi:glycosyltransferase involved in cell wall biosynthesis
MSSNITGILCCYNSESFIEKTLDSILNQTVPLECLVIVNDFSTDSTEIELEKYLTSQKRSIPNIKIIKNPCNMGISMSYNIGLKACESRYSLLLSHDDINAPHRVAATAEAFSQGASIVCSYMNVPDNSTEIQPPENPEKLALTLGLVNKIPAPSVGFDVQAMKMRNLYFNPQCDYAEDYDLWCQCILKGLKFFVIPDALVSYTRHDRQVSKNKIEELKCVAEKVRINYLRSLFPFQLEAQSETLLKIVLLEPHLISSIDPGFIDYLCKAMDTVPAHPSIRSVYDELKLVLTGR